MTTTTTSFWILVTRFMTQHTHTHMELKWMVTTTKVGNKESHMKRLEKGEKKMSNESGERRKRSGMKSVKKTSMIENWNSQVNKHRCQWWWQERERKSKGDREISDNVDNMTSTSSIDTESWNRGCTACALLVNCVRCCDVWERRLCEEKVLRRRKCMQKTRQHCQPAMANVWNENWWQPVYLQAMKTSAMHFTAINFWHSWLVCWLPLPWAAWVWRVPATLAFLFDFFWLFFFFAFLFAAAAVVATYYEFVSKNLRDKLWNISGA